MKTLLAILLSFIVTEAPVFALHGGYTLGGTSSVIGTYAGVMVPISNTVIASGTAETGISGDFGSDALGIFTLGIPDTGIGAGGLVVFSGNNELVGGVAALPDPNNSAGIVGVVQASDYETLITINAGAAGNATLQQLVAQAGGFLTAVTSSSLTSSSPNGINLSGSAILTFSAPEASSNTVVGGTTTNTAGGNLVPFSVVTFAVDGFQQSSVDTITTGS
jgi:hypothetical protein